MIKPTAFYDPETNDFAYELGPDARPTYVPLYRTDSYQVVLPRYATEDMFAAWVSAMEDGESWYECYAAMARAIKENNGDASGSTL